MLNEETLAQISAGDLPRAVALLQIKPGLFVRSVDWASRVAGEQGSEVLEEGLLAVFPHVAGRVLLGLRESPLCRDGAARLSLKSTD